MEVISLGIMALGLLALLSIYIIGRRANRSATLPKRDMPLVPIKNEQGKEVSSVLEDNAALEGKRPVAAATHSLYASQDYDEMETIKDTELESNAFRLPPRLVLFIAHADGNMFEGSAVLAALTGADLHYGDMKIYHRMILTDAGEVSLFSVANGVHPWTLAPDELNAGATPGLCLILNLPSPIDDSEAIHDFIYTAEQMSTQLGGVLKDHNHMPFTPEVRDQVLHFLGVAA